MKYAIGVGFPPLGLADAYAYVVWCVLHGTVPGVYSTAYLRFFGRDYFYLALVRCGTLLYICFSKMRLAGGEVWIVSGLGGAAIEGLPGGRRGDFEDPARAEVLPASRC